jgi:hypothetical protein
MQYAVPIVSWIVCVPLSLWFGLAWSVSGMDTPGPYMDASAYLWAALPALILSTLLLARRAKPARWISCATSALPWAAYPWAVCAGVPSGERPQWLALGKVLGFAFAVCIVVPVALRIHYLRWAGQATEPSK